MPRRARRQTPEPDIAGYIARVIFFGFGSPRFLLFFLLLFLLGPLFLYSPGVALVVGGIVLLAALGSGTSGRRRERAAPRVEEPLPDARPFEEVREAAEEDLLALADGIRALDIDVELPGASPAARQDYERALDLYDAAKRAFDRARAPSDFEPASVAVEEGRFAIASAQARLEGRAPPERRPPCFFDQRHGPSVRDVAWAPPGGTTRPVPACAADAIRIGGGGGSFGARGHGGRSLRALLGRSCLLRSWAGGSFGAFGSLVPGLLLGSVLGAGLTGFGAFELGEEEGDFGGAGDFDEG